MNVTIRKSTPQDWQIIQKLNNEVFEDNAPYDDALDASWPSSDAGIVYYKKVTTDPAVFCFIAELDGKPVGYLVGTERKYGYRKARLAEIDNMGVSAAFRSNGIGEKLIAEYRKWAKEHGFDRLYVNAYVGNEKAIAFYKKCGLTPIDISLEGLVSPN